MMPISPSCRTHINHFVGRGWGVNNLVKQKEVMRTVNTNPHVYAVKLEIIM